MARPEFPRAPGRAPTTTADPGSTPVAPLDAELAVTETSNPRTVEIDRLATPELVALLVEEDAAVQRALQQAVPALTRATDALLDVMSAGGRWFNLGAGTSGRLGVLDASEIPPTFGMDPECVQGVIAGGAPALRCAVEGAEDSRENGALDLERLDFVAADALVALSASGRTPYVLGATEHAHALGARTIGITCVPGSELARAVSIPIVLEVGPEVISGSTRMKGGLAQKQALHTLSTAVMVRLGRTWGNRMSHLSTTNQKLRERAVRTLCERSGCTLAEATAALEAAGGSLQQALCELEPRD